LWRSALPVVQISMTKSPKRLFSRINQRHFVIHEWLRFKGVIHRVIRSTGLKRRYIEKWVKRYQKTGTVNDSPRSGRPRVLQPRQVASLVKGAAAQDSVPAALAALQKKGLVPRWISVKTAGRAAKRYLAKKTARVQPVLTATTKAKRLAFCRQRHLLKQIVAVDSTILTAGSFGSRRKVWSKLGTKPVIQKVRKGQQLHVYAGITRYGATKLIRVTGTTGLVSRFTRAGGVEKYRGVCAKEFQQVMRQHLVPQAKRILRAKRQGPPVFLLDGATPHTAADTRNFMRARKIKYLKGWPPNSPDLNPIENVWAWLKRETEMEKPGTGPELWRVAQEKWKRVTPARCHKYMCSFPRRLVKCIQRNGEHTGY